MTDLKVNFIRWREECKWACYCTMTWELIGYSNQLGLITHNIDDDLLIEAIPCLVGDSVMDYDDEFTFAI